MTFYFLIGVYFIVFIFSWIYISAKWRHYVSDDIFPEINMLISCNRLDRVWPTDFRFLSLKLSVLRHTLISLLSAIAIQIINTNLLNTILLTLNALYTCISFLRYRRRRNVYNDHKRYSDADCKDDISISLFTPVKNACFISCFASIASYVLLFVAYATRP